MTWWRITDLPRLTDSVSYRRTLAGGEESLVLSRVTRQQSDHYCEIVLFFLLRCSAELLKRPTDQVVVTPRHHPLSCPVQPCEWPRNGNRQASQWASKTGDVHPIPHVQYRSSRASTCYSSNSTNLRYRTLLQAGGSQINVVFVLKRLLFLLLVVLLVPPHERRR